MKKKTKTETKNTFEYKTAPTTAADGVVDAAFAESSAPDPSIPYQAANAQKALDNQLSNEFGADYSPETAAAMKSAGSNQIMQQQGQALAMDSYRRKQTKFGNAMAIRQARAPQLVQTGGTGTQTTNAADFWNNLISGGIMGGLSAI